MLQARLHTAIAMCCAARACAANPLPVAAGVDAMVQPLRPTRCTTGTHLFFSHGLLSFDAVRARVQHHHALHAGLVYLHRRGD